MSLPEKMDGRYMAAADAPRKPTGDFVDTLLLGGLLLGLATMLMDGHALAQQAPGSRRDGYEVIVRPSGYRELKSLELGCVLLAGIVAYRREGRFSMGPLGRFALVVLLVWMSGHAIIQFRGGFSAGELIGAKGPVVWWAMLVLFAGCSNDRWQRLSKIFLLIVFVGCAETVFRVSMLAGHFGREEAGRALRHNLSLLLWVTPVVSFVQARGTTAKMLKFAPIMCIFLGALVTGTRSWLAFSFLYSLLYAYVQLASARWGKIWIDALVSTTIAVAVVLTLLFCFCDRQLAEGMDILMSRIDYDTRSSQLREFFDNVGWDELLVGTGPRGTWRMGARDYGHVDGAYFFLLFLGGAPLLASYIVVIIAPAFICAARYRLSEVGTMRFACMLTVLLWALALTGLSIYTAPTTDLTHTVVALCAGRCWACLTRYDWQTSPIGGVPSYEWGGLLSSIRRI